MSKRKKVRLEDTGPDDIEVVARGYFRISDLSREEKAAMARGERTYYSDALQIRNIKERAERKGWRYDEEGSGGDLDYSAFKKSYQSRPEICRHLEDARKGLFNKLMVYKVSRLGRDLLEALTLIREFQQVGVSVYFVSEDLDTSNRNHRVILNMFLTMAEGASEEMGEFLKEAFRQRALEGKTHGTLPAWIERRNVGTDELPKYELAVNETQADNFRRMVELRLEGHGYAKLAQIMNVVEGRRTLNGKCWTLGMVAKYLREDFIQTMQGTSFFGRGQEDAIAILQAFEPIITPEQADRLRAVQALYAARNDNASRLPGWKHKMGEKKGRLSGSTVHLLSGIVRCPRCGGSMVGGMRTDDLEHRSTPYKYSCPNAITHPGHVPYMNSTVGSGLDDAVLRVVVGALKEPPPPEALKAKKPRGTTRSVKATEEAMNRLMDAFLRGVVKQHDFDARYPALEAERDELIAAEAEDVAPEQIRIAHEIAASDPIWREQLRQLVLVMVERVEANVLQEGEYIRSGSTSPRRLARVTLRFPRGDGARVFLAPIYTASWQGKREFWHCDDEPQNGVIAATGTNFLSWTGERWRPCGSRWKTASLPSRGLPRP